jgi:hypothetical protein
LVVLWSDVVGSRVNLCLAPYNTPRGMVRVL